MMKAEMLRFLEPFTDEVEIRMWNGTIWAPAEAKAEYSARSGRTTIYLEFSRPVKPKEQG